MTNGHDSMKLREGSGNPGVQGRWTESREDGGGGVLEHEREGAEQRGGWDGSLRLLNALECAVEGKRGRQGGPMVGAVWRPGTGKKEGARVLWRWARVACIGPRWVGSGGGVAAR
jgi:hypothetical protein